MSAGWLTQTIRSGRKKLLDEATHAAVDHDAFVTPEDWTLVSSFSDSWVNYSATLGGFQQARYRKTPDGTVHIQGLVKSGSMPGTIFTLPAGYRPDDDLIFVTYTNTGIGRLDVQNGGDVNANAGGTGFFSINCSFGI